MKKAVYIVLAFSLILSLLTGCGGSTRGKSLTEEKSNISIKTKITGLEEGDSVMIINGRIPENPPSGDYRLKDPFKMKVEKNGITPLPIHKEGKWSIEAGAEDYGEMSATSFNTSTTSNTTERLIFRED